MNNVIYLKNSKYLMVLQFFIYPILKFFVTFEKYLFILFKIIFFLDIFYILLNFFQISKSFFSQHTLHEEFIILNFYQSIDYLNQHFFDIFIYLMIGIFIFSLICFLFFIFKKYFIFKNIFSSNKHLNSLSFLKTDKKICFRIEKNGIGPFRHSSTKNYFKKIEDTDNTPTPYTEFKEYFLYLEFLSIEHYFYCAFKEKEDYKKWFSEEDINFLIQNDFSLNIYEIHEYLEGNTQIIFNKKNSKLLKNILLKNI